jgi:hypothetical protein
MAFIDDFNDAKQAVRDAEARVAEALRIREQPEALRATHELAGARIALAIFSSANLLGPLEGRD